GQDGTACWHYGRKSFFRSAGVLNTPDDVLPTYDRWGNAIQTGECSYFYVLPGARINNYNGIPALDVFGFARSAAYNPTYYDPAIKYEPWLRIVNEEVQSYPDASTSATLIDPRETDTLAIASSYLGTSSWDVQRMQEG
ncbi:hypothetical protein J6396_41420, partial [Pseudomonas aeruginosa]|nr:hypothetical protein [Pseudomonas aeruginosa]